MAGDLLVTNIDEKDLDVLLAAGGTLDTNIFHSDKYGQGSWNTWMGRLQEGLNGSAINNRVALPPHFYISFRISDYKGTGNYPFSKLIWASLRPLTIVSNKQSLANWEMNSTALEAERQFHQALQLGAITLEIYGYEGSDLVNRNTGKILKDLSYMKLVPE
jgi:hypothetical protein